MSDEKGKKQMQFFFSPLLPPPPTPLPHFLWLSANPGTPYCTKGTSARIHSSHTIPSQNQIGFILTTHCIAPTGICNRLSVGTSRALIKKNIVG
ncbi:hypothetical protein Bpfe_019676, partial [Biomphalaria pfeifferi]